MNNLEKNKIFGTEQNPQNGVPGGGTEVIFERNKLFLEAAKKCLERHRKPHFSEKNNESILNGQSCSTFFVSREWNSGTEAKNLVPGGGTEAVLGGNSLFLEAAKKCLERHRKPHLSEKNNEGIRDGQSCSTFSEKWNSGATLQNSVPGGGTEVILGINTNETVANPSVCNKSLEETNIPAIWQEAINQTLQRERPENITEQKWQAIISPILLWPNQKLPQLQKIIADGWTIQNIFGCHKLHPEQRIDRMGLLMLIHGKTIKEIQMGAISLKTSSGAEQCFYKNILSSPEDGLIYNLG